MLLEFVVAFDSSLEDELSSSSEEELILLCCLLFFFDFAVVLLAITWFTFLLSSVWLSITALFFCEFCGK